MGDNLKGILEASYQPQRQASENLQMMGYTYDPELSTMENKVFVDKDNKPHIAYRGSVRVSDWADNLKMALTGKSEKIDQKVDLAKRVQDKYGEAPTTYGHSRGGYASEKAGEATGGKSYTYNKATLPQDIFKSIRNDQTDIRTSKDIISLPSFFQSGGSKQTIKSGLFDNIFKSHSISQLK
jgi:hypothetical protein